MIKRLTALSGALSIAGSIAATATAVAGPSVSTNWTSTTLTQSECLRKAESAVRDAGLGRNFQVVGQSVFGQRDSYTALVRCITEKKFIYFVVAGPKIDETKQRLRDIFGHF